MSHVTFKPTAEQRQAADMYRSGESLRIEALAGTGKTSTLRYLVEQGSPRGGKILYTSFGAKVIRDAKASFPAHCSVRTNHSLAWAVGRVYQAAGRLQSRVSAGELIQHFGWRDSTFAPYVELHAGACAVIETIVQFCQTADDTIGTVHALPAAVRMSRQDSSIIGPLAAKLSSLASEVWVQMMRTDSALPIVHDVYLKKWALTHPRITARTCLLDEAQDANGVIVGVLKEQEQAQLVIVGDRRQAIYGWRGAVDAMDAFAIAHSTQLTQSFRFGPEIAEVANAILRNECEANAFLKGDTNQPGTVGRCASPSCVLARKNATLVGQLFEIERSAPASRVGVVGGVDDLVNLLESVSLLKQGRPAQHPELVEFSDWGRVRAASEHEAYRHLRTLVRLVEEFGVRHLIQGLDRVRGNERAPDLCDVLLSTVHKAKGAEFASVKIMDDFPVKGPPDDIGLHGWTQEEANVLYVACTRARAHLDVESCEAVMAAWGDAPFPGGAGGGRQAPVDPEENVDWDVAFCPLERVGEWAHPQIEGAHVRIEKDGALFTVVVHGNGYELLRAAGEQIQGFMRADGSASVVIGAATIAVSPQALQEVARVVG